jgi:hypothetical protein
MQKSLFFIIISFLIFETAYCQKEFRIGISFMPQIILTGHDYTKNGSASIPINREYEIKHSTGLNLDYYFNRFIIRSGIIYSKQGQNFGIGFNNAYPEMDNRTYEITLNYLKIPFCFEYAFMDIGNSVEIKGLAGLYYSLLVKENDNYQRIIPEAILLLNAGKWYSNYDYGLTFGLEFGIKNIKDFILNIGIIADIGLNDLYSDEPWGYIWELQNMKTTLIGFKIGLDYRISN